MVSFSRNFTVCITYQPPLVAMHKGKATQGEESTAPSF